MIGCFNIEVSHKEEFSLGIKEQGEHLSFDVQAKKDIAYSMVQQVGLLLNLSLVCTVGKDSYLMVEPQVMWVTEDMIKELLIKSNVEWIIS